MDKKALFIILAVTLILPARFAWCQDLFVYPAQGQSQEQLEQDKYACYQWAKQQTGFDPMQAQQAPPPGTTTGQPGGEVVRGAARGALVGAVVGEIADDDAGKGAAAGAAGGALIGGMKRRDKAAHQQQAQQQSATQQQQLKTDYDRAYAACLEAKGYTVK